MRPNSGIHCRNLVVVIFNLKNNLIDCGHSFTVDETIDVIKVKLSKISIEIHKVLINFYSLPTPG